VKHPSRSWLIWTDHAGRAHDASLFTHDAKARHCIRVVPESDYKAVAKELETLKEQYADLRRLLDDIRTELNQKAA
jgi:hypothetical protein